MTKNECLNNLMEACKQLESIENIENVKNNVFSYVVPVVDYYKFLQDNYSDDEDTMNKSLSMVLQVRKNNPKLKGVVDAIIDFNESINEQKKVRI